MASRTIDGEGEPPCRVFVTISVFTDCIRRYGGKREPAHDFLCDIKSCEKISSNNTEEIFREVLIERQLKLIDTLKSRLDDSGIELTHDSEKKTGDCKSSSK